MTPRYIATLARKWLHALYAQREQIDEQIACMELVLKQQRTIDGLDAELDFFRRREIERLDQAWTPQETDPCD